MFVLGASGFGLWVSAFGFGVDVRKLEKGEAVEGSRIQVEGLGCVLGVRNRGSAIRLQSWDASNGHVARVRAVAFTRQSQKPST